MTTAGLICIAVAGLVALWLFRKPLLLRTLECGLSVWFIRDVLPHIRVWPQTKGASTLLAGESVEHPFPRLPGRIVLGKDRWRLSSLLTPGYWDHAAILFPTLYNINLQPCFVGEMTAAGYTETTWQQFCRRYDRVVVLECEDWTPDYIGAKVIPALRRIDEADIPYDFAFELGWKALYCSELIYAVDPEHRLKADLQDRIGVGGKYISPQDIYEARNVKVVWDSCQAE